MIFEVGSLPSVLPKVERMLVIAALSSCSSWNRIPWCCGRNAAAIQPFSIPGYVAKSGLLARLVGGREPCPPPAEMNGVVAPPLAPEATTQAATGWPRSPFADKQTHCTCIARLRPACAATAIRLAPCPFANRQSVRRETSDRAGARDGGVFLKSLRIFSGPTQATLHSGTISCGSVLPCCCSAFAQMHLPANALAALAKTRSSTSLREAGPRAELLGSLHCLRMPNTIEFAKQTIRI